MHFHYSFLLLIGASLLLAGSSASSWRANSDDNEDQTNSKGWWDSGKFQGDIAGFEDQNDFDNNFVRRLNSWQNRSSSWRLHSAISDPRGLWPNGRVPYVVLSHLDKLHVAVNQAMQEIQNSTCVRFVPKTNEIDYLRIVDSDDGCWSFIGNRRQGARGQLISLTGDWCHNKQTALHELMHAIGFWHEHQRTDRDEHVEVIEDNIQPECYRQNYAVAPFDRMLLIGRYDVDSVMHYPSKAGSCAKPGRDKAMKLKNSDREDFGASRSLTNEDVRKIRILYGCNSNMQTTTLRATTLRRQTTTPVNCPRCNCPSCPDCDYPVIDTPTTYTGSGRQACTKQSDCLNGCCVGFECDYWSACSYINS